MTTKSSGFSLVELLVVIAIIGVLSAVGTLTYQGYIAGTKKKTAKNAMMQIALGQTEYYSNEGKYYYTDGCEADTLVDDNDGIDDVVVCVGDYDECGEGNGDGINEGACDCDGNIIDECGECGGDGSSCEILPFEFLSPLDGDEWINGSEQTISWIGGSTFMPLKISLIASETDESEWYTLDTIILETENPEAIPKAESSLFALK